MSKPEAVFKIVVFLTIAGGIGFVVYRAGQGDQGAIFLLGAGVAIVVMIGAFAMFIGAIWAVSKVQQTAFINNARENMSIVSAIASTQSRQNQLLARQVKQLSPHPEPQDSLLIDDGVFSALEEN